MAHIRDDLSTGRRIYVQTKFGEPVVEKLKDAGCKWDAAAKCWWAGAAKRAAIEAVLVQRDKDEDEGVDMTLKKQTPDDIRLTGKGKYKGREYYAGSITKDGTKVKDFTVNHKGTVSYTNGSGEQKESVIRFNQAGFHRSPKMIAKKMNSRGGELLRTLSINLGSNLNKGAVEQALREADGRTMGRGVVNWEAYCKDDKQVVSTNPNSKKGDARWPKGTDGKYVTEVQCPKCGAALSGRERITDYKLPQG